MEHAAHTEMWKAIKLIFTAVNGTSVNDLFYLEWYYIWSCCI